MAFRTNKVPAIEERTVSGSSVSFNSAFALPLKACKVSFTGTQEGSGTPAPDNVRPLTYKASTTVTGNSIPHIINFGGRRFFDFDLDILNGTLTAKKEIITIDENSGMYVGYDMYIKSDACDAYITNEKISPSTSAGNHGLNFANCDRLRQVGVQIWTNVGYPNCISINYQYIHINIANDVLGITDYTQETRASAQAKINAWLAENPLTVAIPVNEVIQLSANELSSILGNNTFSTDTGTLELTFADLQEKSASGSVASFNTALAKNLVSCDVNIDAWEEGTGEKSPSNPYVIHGWDSVTVTANDILLVKALGQIVYGAILHLDTGILEITWYGIEYDGSIDENWRQAGSMGNNNRYLIDLPLACKNRENSSTNYLKYYSPVAGNWGYYTFANVPYNIFTVKDRNGEFASISDFLIYLRSHPLQLIYEIETPIEVQLTPEQIQTIIGSNTIFADTGDVDLTYKDLDIAKRGNFREVFRLPS